MKPRHAAALALVGWYLMLPPPALNHLGDQRFLPDAEAGAPLWRWTIVGSYDTAAACMTELDRRTAAGNRFLNAVRYHEYTSGELLKSPRLSTQLTDTYAAFRNKNSACIATDDPRLKRN